MTETVTVYYSPVGPAFHKTVVYTSSDGQSFYTTSFATDSPLFFSTWDKLSAVVDAIVAAATGGRSPFGTLAVSTNNPFNSNNLIKDTPQSAIGVTHDENGIPYPSETVALGSDLSEYWKAVNGSYEETGRANLAYSPATQNSDEAADKALWESRDKLPEDAAFKMPENDDFLDSNWSPASNSPFGEAVDKVLDKGKSVLEWLFGSKNEDTTADKSEVLDQQVGSNTGSGVGDGHSAIHIEAPSIFSIAGDMAASFAGMIGGVIGSIASSIGGAISAGISGIGNFIGGVIDFFTGGSAPDSGSGSGGGNMAAPVIIDLDNDGIELSSLHKSSTFFDIDGDGYLEKTAWAGKDDGLLVVDLFKDGRVDFAEELNFRLCDAAAKTDMQALRNVFDSNNNNTLDSGDERFAEFKIWQDINQNGRVDATYGY